MFRYLLLDRIGRKCRKDRAAARQDAEDGADRRAAQNGADHCLEILARRHQVGHLRHQHGAGLFAFEIAQDFSDTEDADRDRDEVQAVGIFPDSEREARRAGVDIGADEAKQQAKADHGERLDDRPVSKRDRRDETDDHQREIFRRPELQRDRGQRRREDRHKKGGNRAGEERSDGSDGKRRSRLALARHLVTVDGGDRRRGFARHIDEDGRGGAAILRAVVDAGQHDQRRHGFELEGDRQQHGDRRRCADAGQDADQRAKQHPDEAEEQVLDRRGGGETEGEIVE